MAVSWFEWSRCAVRIAIGCDAGDARSLGARRGYMAPGHCALMTRLPNLPLTAGSFEPRSFRDGGLHLFYRSGLLIGPQVVAHFLAGHPCANSKTTQKKSGFLPKTIAQICRLTVHLLMDRLNTRPRTRGGENGKGDRRLPFRGNASLARQIFQQHVRIRHRDNDWLVRTDVSKSIGDLFCLSEERGRHFCMASARKEQNTWPRIAASEEWRIGRVRSTALVHRKHRLQRRDLGVGANTKMPSKHAFSASLPASVAEAGPSAVWPSAITACSMGRHCRRALLRHWARY